MKNNLENKLEIAIARGNYLADWKIVFGIHFEEQRNQNPHLEIEGFPGPILDPIGAAYGIYDYGN